MAQNDRRNNRIKKTMSKVKQNITETQKHPRREEREEKDKSWREKNYTGKNEVRRRTNITKTQRLDGEKRENRRVTKNETV